MSPPRDSFGQALAALRRRLRDAVDAPGAPLPISLIAAELRLSTTPVREALSRLAGEELVEKIGPNYTRPSHDPATLAELYELRWTYLAACLAAEPRRGTGPAARSLPDEVAPALEALIDESPGRGVERLLCDLVVEVGDLTLARAFLRVNERLAPLQGLEARAFSDLREEALALLAVRSDRAALRSDVRRYHRRRSQAAGALARLSDPRKYRSDIV